MEEPRICETGGKKAVFLEAETGSVLFCVGVLWCEFVGDGMLMFPLDCLL